MRRWLDQFRRRLRWWWRDRPRRLRIIVLSVLVLTGLAAALWGASQGRFGWDWGGLALDFGSELTGAVAIYIVLEKLVGGQETKKRLIEELGSQVNQVAVTAAEELRRRGCLSDGSLRGAHLWGADLRGTKLGGDEFDEDTTLPDGERWTPEIDLARFTDPDHPEFWRSNEPWSPAYRGEGQGGDDDDDN